MFCIPMRFVSGMRKSAPSALQTTPAATKTAVFLPILFENVLVFCFMFSKLFQDFVSNIQKFLKRVFTNEKMCAKMMARINVLKENDYGF